MKTAHVNDRDIQHYIFDLEKIDGTIIQHINSCDRCKTIAESYKLLSEELKEQPEPILGFNLADLVIEQIPSEIPYQQKKGHTPISILTVMGFGVLAMVLSAVKTDLSNLFEVSNLSTYFSISIGIFITILWGLDMIKSFNRKMDKINFS